MCNHKCFEYRCGCESSVPCKHEPCGKRQCRTIKLRTEYFKMCLSCHKRHVAITGSMLREYITQHERAVLRMLHTYTDRNAYSDARRQASEWEWSAKSIALGLEVSVLDMWQEVAKIARLGVCSYRYHPWETASDLSSTGNDDELTPTESTGGDSRE